MLKYIYKNGNKVNMYKIHIGRLCKKRKIIKFTYFLLTGVDKYDIMTFQAECIRPYNNVDDRVRHCIVRDGGRVF